MPITILEAQSFQKSQDIGCLREDNLGRTLAKGNSQILLCWPKICNLVLRFQGVFDFVQLGDCVSLCAQVNIVHIQQNHHSL